jgi:hypothetical protein
MGTADPFRTLRSYVWAGTVLACALHPLGAQEPPPAMEGDGVATTLNELATEYGIEIIWDQGPYEDEYPGGRREMPPSGRSSCTRPSWLRNWGCTPSTW